MVAYVVRCQRDSVEGLVMNIDASYDAQTDLLQEAGACRVLKLNIPRRLQTDLSAVIIADCGVDDHRLVARIDESHASRKPCCAIEG
jgi:hypothetical protein